MSQEFTPVPASLGLDTFIQRARVPYPIILAVTHEEERVLDGILHHVVGRTDRGFKKDHEVFVWSVTAGLQKVPPGLKSTSKLYKEEPLDIGGINDPIKLLTYIATGYDAEAKREEGVRRSTFILRGFPLFLNKNPTVARKLRDIYYKLVVEDKCIVLVGSTDELPDEMAKHIAVCDLGLPDANEIRFIVEAHLDFARRAFTVARERLAVSGEEITDEKLERRIGLHPASKLEYSEREMLTITNAALGLTRAELLRVMDKSFSVGHFLDPIIVSEEKEQIVRKSGILEFWKSAETMADVGGLDSIKEYLEETHMSFEPEAKLFGADDPRGILLIGKPGSAKSLVAKASAKEFGLPLLRLDVGKVMQGLVGSSESNMRRALDTATVVAPCVFWIDEIDKSISGTKSSNYSDGGTLQRVVGTLIHFMQERSAPVWIAATANDVSQLPPELSRKGRIDEVFYFDLPTEEEKREIFAIHLAKRGRDPSLFDLKQLAKVMYTSKNRTYGYSGAEIEAAIQEAIRKAYFRARKQGVIPVIGSKYDVDTELLSNCLRLLVPMAKTYDKNMKKLRTWAEDRARWGSERQRLLVQGTAATEDEDDEPDLDEVSLMGSGPPRRRRR